MESVPAPAPPGRNVPPVVGGHTDPTTAEAASSRLKLMSSLLPQMLPTTITLVPSGETNLMLRSLSYVWVRANPTMSTSDKMPMVPGTLRVEVVVARSAMSLGTSEEALVTSHAGVLVGAGVKVAVGVNVLVGVAVGVNVGPPQGFWTAMIFRPELIVAVL